MKLDTYSYTWSPGTNLGATNTAQPEAWPASDTRYYLTVSENGCEDTNSVLITVLPVPNVSIDPLASDSICNGDSIQLNANGTGTFTWTPSSGLSNPNIADPKAGPSSNTTYEVELSNGTCSSTDAVTIYVVSGAFAGNDISRSYCEDEGASVLFSLLTGADTTGRWEYPEGTPYSTEYNFVFDPETDSSGEYLYITTGVGDCNPDTANVTITVNPLPDIMSTADTSIFSGEEITLATIDSAGYTYIWTDGNQFSSSGYQIMVSPEESITYYLTVENTYGCDDTASVFVLVNNMPPVIFNTITPNGDGINDEWTISNIERYEDHTVEVYNRAGNLVFESVDYSQKKWDGTYKGNKVPAGVYYYLIKIGSLDIKTGSVTVIY